MPLYVPSLLPVAKGELTCLGCGETFPTGWNCPRCALDDKGEPTRHRPPTVATVSYLREGEYRIVS